MSTAGTTKEIALLSDEFCAGFRFAKTFKCNFDKSAPHVLCNENSEAIVDSKTVRDNVEELRLSLPPLVRTRDSAE